MDVLEILQGHRECRPLNGTFYTAVADETDNRIDSFAERMYQMSRILRG